MNDLESKINEKLENAFNTKVTESAPVYDKINSGHSNSYEKGQKFMYAGIRAFKKKYGIELTPYLTKKEQFYSGETMEGFEFKLDEPSEYTGRISVEIAERVSNRHYWVSSGIFRYDNTRIYCQGNKDVLWGFSVKKLRELYNKKKEDGTPYYQRHTKPTVDTFYIPWADCDRYCMYKIGDYKD